METKVDHETLNTGDGMRGLFPRREFHIKLIIIITSTIIITTLPPAIKSFPPGSRERESPGGKERKRKEESGWVGWSSSSKQWYEALNEEGSGG